VFVNLLKFIVCLFVCRKTRDRVFITINENRQTATEVDNARQRWMHRSMAKWTGWNENEMNIISTWWEQEMKCSLQMEIGFMDQFEW